MSTILDTRDLGDPIRGDVTLLFLALSAPTHAAPDVAAAFTTYQAHARFAVPAPTADQIAKLEAGKIVRVRVAGSADAPTGAMGMVLTDVPRQNLWLGSIDDDFAEHESLVVHDLPTVGDEMFRWYGFVDLPAPVSDRHFLIRTTVNRALPTATENTMWARHWSIEAGGEDLMRPEAHAGRIDRVTGQSFDRAIFTPTNLGAWIFLDVEGGQTLFIYHAATSLGGSIPDAAVTRYVYWGLSEIIETVLSQARAMPTHYRAGHKQWLGGDGQPIPFYE